MENKKSYNATIDYAKLIFAILVVGIHTEPFGFNFWLDKSFGIVTRLCVPFFFVCSSFFYFSNEKVKNAKSYLWRLFVLFIIWSLIYLPFDRSFLKDKSTWEIFEFYTWSGPSHALWYLSGSIMGFIIIIFLLRLLRMRKEYIFVISLCLLLIGCIITTYSPLFERLFSICISNDSDCRNGLFYAFPYMALGMIIAKYHSMRKDVTDEMSIDEMTLARVPNNRFRLRGGYFIGFIISTLVLCVESLFFVVVLKTNHTILWLSILPMTFFFFMWLLGLKITRSREISLWMRKMSTLIFVSHGLFLMLFSRYFDNFMFFVVVTVTSAIFSHIIITLSRKRAFAFLVYLY